MEQEIKNLFLQYKKSGDRKIRDKIVEKYLYIAQIIAKKFVGRGVEYDDLYQVAALALIKGIDRFDPDMGLEFTTFITPTITGEIKNYFRDKSRLIKVPRKLAGLNMEISKAKGEFVAKNGRAPTAKELSLILSVSEEDILRAQEVGGVVSLDSASTYDGDGEEEGSKYDYIPDMRDFFGDFENREAVASAIKQLNETEKRIVAYRYGEELSQAETAKRLNVSQMFISRMERKILGKLREYLSE